MEGQAGAALYRWLPAGELVGEVEWVVGRGQAGEAGALLTDAAASVQRAQGVRPYSGDGVDVRAAAQGDQIASSEDAKLGGLGAQLLEADAAEGVHPLLVRQEFVVEPDEAVQGGEHEDAGGTGDPRQALPRLIQHRLGSREELSLGVGGESA